MNKFDYKEKNMKKKAIILGGIMLSALMFTGCGKAISNDMIAIKQYKKLEVSRPKDENNYSENVAFKDNIWKALIEQCTLKEYPNEEMEQLTEQLRLEYSYVVTEHSNPEELIEEIHGMTVEKLAEQELKKRYAIQLIAEKEGLTLTDKEYQKELEKDAKTNGMTSDEYESLLGRNKQYQMYLEERVLGYLKEHLK